MSRFYYMRMRAFQGLKYMWNRRKTERKDKDMTLISRCDRKSAVFDTC